MATVTALPRACTGASRSSSTARPWRTVPVVAAAEARLTVGRSLDRERARALGRRSAGIAHAMPRFAPSRGATTRRATLDARLERAGVRATERSETLEAADRAGLVDDARFAAARAQQLADAGRGRRCSSATTSSGTASTTPRPAAAVAVARARARPRGTDRRSARREPTDAPVPRRAGLLGGVARGLVADLESRALG